MHIQFHTQFQLVQQCIQLSTRINILQCTYVHLRCSTLRVILQGFVDPKCNISQLDQEAQCPALLAWGLL